MKTQVMLVVALCVALAVGFTVASDKASKGCGCGMKDQVISLNDTGLLPDDAQLTGLTSAFPTKCKKKCAGLSWWMNKNGKCCWLGKWYCKPPTMECKKGW